MIVTEDDVYVNWETLSLVVREHWHGMGIDYLKLTAPCYPAKFRVLSIDTPIRGHHLVQYKTPTLVLGATAYLVTAFAAEKF